MNVSAFCNTLSSSDFPTFKSEHIVVEHYTDNQHVLPVSAETIPPQLVGTVVDTLTRFMLIQRKHLPTPFPAHPLNSPFRVSYLGALHVKKHQEAETLIASISGLDDSSLLSACRLACFDVVLRAGKKHYKGFDHIYLDKNTCNNIRIMVERSVQYLTEHNVKSYGNTFLCGYTEKVNKGDCDFICKTGIIDLKVYSTPIKIKDWLQVLTYHLLACRHDKFKSRRDGPSLKSRYFHSLYLFNPRENKSYSLRIKKITEKELAFIKEKGWFDE